MKELYLKYRESTGVCTDTRKITPGCMFFALRGENFDGNEFALKALEGGALYSVVDSPALAEIADSRLICVENVLDTLQQLARFHRMQYDIPVVGITGTNGKTTTKELVAAVLRSSFDIVCTQGNLNNHIGVPLTLFNISESTQIAVVEMGANHPGEIALSASLARPTVGLITNVGRAHLEGFGSFEGVKNTKGELYDFLVSVNGKAICNADSEDISQMAAIRPQMAVEKYGVGYQNAEILPVTVENPYLRIKVDGRVINTNLVGRYNADNVLAAICVGRHFGITLESAAAAIESYVPSNNRSQMVSTGRNLLIVDAYNANYTSMNAALDNFAATEFPSKSLILGDMLELGEFSRQAHSEILAKARAITSDIYLVGRSEFRAVAGESEKVFETSADLKDYIAANPVQGRSILIKGSNGTKLNLLIESL